MKKNNDKIEYLKTKYKIKECTVKLMDFTENFYYLRASPKKLASIIKHSNRIDRKSRIRLFKNCVFLI